jgi:ADP-heptose:LPS heptosyltransferase
MTINEPKESLSIENILKLGLTKEEFEEFSNDKPNEVMDYVDINPEMVVARIKHDCKLLNIEQFKEFAAKKGQYLIMRMVNFIQLLDKDRVEPTPFFKKYYRSYKGEDLNNKSVLCWVYNAGIGDMLFQQAIIRHLKIKYPRMHFTFAVPQQYIEFIKSWGIIDRVIPNVFEVSHFMNADYHLNFEFVIRSKRGFEENVYKCFADRAFLKIGFHDAYPSIPTLPEAKLYWKNILKKKNINNFIICQFTSANKMRNPRPKFRGDILNKLIKEGYKIVFVDHPSKNEDINKLIKHSKNPKQCFNFTNKSDTLVTSAALMSMADLVLSVDTGAIHMAAALGIPAYGIYGPFNGYIRLATYPNCKWIDPIGLDCIPCLEHDLEACDNHSQGYPKCYDLLDQDKIIKEIKVLLPSTNEGG